MPDKYVDYNKRPVQGGARPSAGSQSSSRPAGSANYGQQPVRRTQSAQSPTRHAGSANYGQQPVRRTQSAQSPTRPAGSANYGQQPVRRTQSAQSPTRPAGSANYGQQPVRKTQSAQSADRRYDSSTPRTRSSQGSQQARRPSSQSGAQRARSGYAPARKKKKNSGGFLGMLPSSTKIICGVLCVALLITVCLAITSLIQSGNPQPTITANTAVPAQQSVQETADAPVVTDAPAATDAPAVTDAPATTDAPAATEEIAQPTQEPAAAVQTGSRTARIRAIGDVIIDDVMLENGEIEDDVYDFSPLFELVGDVMGDADLTMINIEASMRKHKYGYMGFPQFSTPHTILDDLKEVGVDMLTMCNNHALDGYYDGLKMSLDYADAAGMAHVGAYRSQAEYDTPEVYDVNGIKVGMLNYTQYTNGMASLCDEEATIYGMRLMQGADYEGDIADLKNAGAEFTIAIMHWGEEYERQPEDSTMAVARRLVAAGVDLIIGGHPHVVQPAVYMTETMADGTSNTALVIYSIGNFVSEHRHESVAYTDNGVILDFTLQENDAGEIELVDPYVIPIYMWQIPKGNSYDYKAVASGEHLDDPIAEMSSSQYNRMKASYQEIEALMAGVLPVRAN